jgi:hypothetical protein
LKTYKLTASSVQGAIKGLLDKDFVTCELGEYKVYDKFFSFCDDSIVNHVINTLLINLVILQQIPQGQTQIHIPELRQFL